jgi:NitT/TauT family transport system ATP-binding protein
MMEENTSDNAPKIAVDHVSKWFRSQPPFLHALDDVSFTVQEGEFVCLVGPSGCGKSTLLNMVGGFETPDTGTVKLDGGVVTGPGRDRILLFQEPALFPWLNVIDNVLFGLKLKPGLTDKQRLDTALQYLELVGLELFQTAFIHELSGGMKQRVALARALAPNPDILLMDEPFASLDAITRAQMYIDLQRICRRYRKTVLFVTHNVAEAVCLGDRVILFSTRPGTNRTEFVVDLPRYRDIDDLKVAEYTNQIVQVFRSIVPLNIPMEESK